MHVLDITPLEIELRGSPVNLCTATVWKMSEDYLMKVLGDRAPRLPLDEAHRITFTEAIKKCIQLGEVKHQAAGIYTLNWGRGKGDLWIVVNNFGGYTIMLPEEYEELENETTL